MENSASLDIWRLYKQMLRSRLFEQAVVKLWNEGKISGEMHMGIGEEAIVAGILDFFREGDAMALDHRGTPPLVMRGINLVSIMREFLGKPDGLCCGMGGHMHLFSKEHLAASSGIVGASGPTATGFALAAQYLRPGTLSVAFFGDGAINQGMLLESMNLAVVWELPVIFVCKDSDWAITTVSSTVTGGTICDRARGFGLETVKLDGSDVETVWKTAKKAVEKARDGRGPTFIHAFCYHIEGHFLGDPLLRLARNPITEMGKMAGSLIKAATKLKGTSLKERGRGLGMITSLLGKTTRELSGKQKDPVEITRKKLESDPGRLQKLEDEVKKEIENVGRFAESSIAEI